MKVFVGFPGCKVIDNLEGRTLAYKWGDEAGGRN